MTDVSKRILIVDDDRLLGQALRIALNFDGHCSECAQNAEEALVRLEQEPFDMVLTDYVLPGLNGRQLAGTIKQRGYGTRVILMSGYIQEDTADTVDLFLHKPFELDCLRDKITQVLGLPSVKAQEALSGA